MLATTTIAAMLSILPMTQAGNAAGAAVCLSDRPDLLTYSQQAWGELGMNESAHQPLRSYSPPSPSPSSSMSSPVSMSCCRTRFCDR